MTNPRTVSRRQFLVRSSLATGAVAFAGPAFLAACGSSGSSKSVSMANWPLYIEDDTNPKASATLKSFKDSTGISVNYQPIVDGNDTFTTKYSPKLQKKQGIGFDLVVVTSWMASRWIKNGWAQPLDAANIPNKANIVDRQANPAFDPGRKYSLPYAEGQVGIAYYPDKVGFEITSINQLLDAKLKGKVTILNELRDSLGLFLLGAGVDPMTAELAAMKKVVDALKKARDAGQFNKITGNEYADILGRGDVAASMAWSGDVATLQKDHPDLKWVLPAEGGMSFVDTMLIPIGAKNKAGAEKLMNHFYDPKVAGPLFETIQYVSSVKGAGDNMTAAAKTNVLINPPATAKISEFRDLDDAESKDLETAWASATQG